VSFAGEPLPELPEVLVISPRVLRDERGAFFESWHADKFADLGLDAGFVQDNQSESRRGVLRGLHYQLPPAAQGKLVRALVGEVFDVAVDLRAGSTTLGRWGGRRLSTDNHEMLWVPPGFAHGFYAMSPIAVVAYKCTAAYSPEHERTLAWDDPEVAVDWPLIDGRPPLLSDKDRDGARLGAAELFP
jgi:dTDP-4-dehydrorhamnose 3,5-epimerase